jgi:hypothetical protein
MNVLFSSRLWQRWRDLKSLFCVTNLLSPGALVMNRQQLLSKLRSISVVALLPALANAQPAALNNAGLAKDADYIASQAKKWNKKNVARATLVGWTASNKAVFRWLQCDADVGGGRGAYCELKICQASSVENGPIQSPECKEGISTSLDAHDALASADIVKKITADVLAFAPSQPGASLPLSDVKLAFKAFDSTIKTKANSAPVALFAAQQSEYGAFGVVSAKITAVSESPDHRCVASFGVAQSSNPQQKKVTRAQALAAVVCSTATAGIPKGIKGALPVVLGVSIGPLKLGMTADEVTALGFLAKKLPTDINPTRMVVTEAFELSFDSKDKLDSIQLDLTNYPDGIIVNGKTFDKKSSEADLLKGVPGCGKVPNDLGGGLAACASNAFVGHAGPIGLVVFRIGRK